MNNQRIDRQVFGATIYPLWEALMHEEAEDYIRSVMEQYPEDPYPYCAIAQTRLSRIALSGRTEFTKEEVRFLREYLEKAASLIDNKKVKYDHVELNTAAVVRTLLATVYLAIGRTSMTQKARKAVEWVTEKENRQSPKYYIESRTMAEAFIKLAICMERLKEPSQAKMQSAVSGAVSYYRKAGDMENMNKAIQVHIELFGYSPISLENITTEFPKFIDQSLQRFVIEE